MRLVKPVLMFLIAVSIVFIGGFLFWFFSPHLPKYVERRSEVFNDRKVTFLLIDLTLANYKFKLVNKPTQAKSVRSWRTDLGAELVFNGGYFNEDFEPTGYLQTANGQKGLPWPSTEVQLEPASYTFLVEVIGGRLDLSYLPALPKPEPTGEALLSFPTLVLDGQPIVKEDSKLYSARTILATGKNGHDYLIITERGSISLYEAADWIARQSEDFIIAGNLDGGPSTGASLENGYFDLEDASAAVPNVFAGYRD